MCRTTRVFVLATSLFVLVLTPAHADTFMVYSQGGIPPASNLFTWCDTGVCDVSEPLSCDTDPFAGVVATPEGGSALRMRANLWGGLGVFLQNDTDLSAYDGGDLRFWVKAPDSGIGPYNLKVEIKCNPDPVNQPAGVAYTTSIAEHGWDGTSAWQELVIPVCDFFPDSTCDPQCLSTMTAPFMSTIEALPVFNQFWIDYVRWHKPGTNAGASSVEVQGRKLVVDGSPFAVNGVAYAPLSIGEDWRGAWDDRPDRYLIDFPLIAASGANTIRLYAPILSKAMLDAAWANGLYVIPNFGVDSVQMTCTAGKNFMQDRFVEMVDEWKDHPAILFWLVGNETNVNLGAADLCADWYPQLDFMAQAAHAAEGANFHPVGTANADTPGLGDICQSGCSDDTSLPNVDLWGAQVYRGCGLSSAFSEYQAKADCGRPLIITEFGVDAYDSMLGAENETLQANCMATQLADAELALAVQNPGGVSSGQVVFEWLDEWWKAECDPGTSWSTHDTCASSTNPSYPDPAINEEWWGITSQNSGDPDARGLRGAYNRVSESWQLSGVCDLEVVSHDAGSGNMTISFAPATGSADHTLYYGPLSAVSSYGYSGSVTGLGVSGSSSVTLPSGSLFWLVAPRNGAEGCYGVDGPGGNERPCFPGSGGCAIPQSAGRTCECGP